MHRRVPVTRVARTNSLFVRSPWGCRPPPTWLAGSTCASLSVFLSAVATHRQTHPPQLCVPATRHRQPHLSSPTGSLSVPPAKTLEGRKSVARGVSPQPYPQVYGCPTARCTRFRGSASAGLPARTAKAGSSRLVKQRKTSHQDPPAKAGGKNRPAEAGPRPNHLIPGPATAPHCL